jgi:hypothetical protein
MIKLIQIGDEYSILQGNYLAKCKVTNITGSIYNGFVIELKQILTPNNTLRTCEPLMNFAFDFFCEGKEFASKFYDNANIQEHFLSYYNSKKP